MSHSYITLASSQKLDSTIHIPPIEVTQEALLEMVDIALSYPTIEVAWGLCGFVQQDGPISISTILPPVLNELEQAVTHTNIGGELLQKEVDWYDMFYQQHPLPEGMIFDYIFSGHSHHQLNVTSYSGVDKRTMNEIVPIGKLDFAVGVLIYFKIIDRQYRASPGASVITLNKDQHYRINVKFYYHSRELQRHHVYEPIVVKPRVISARDLPFVPPLPWMFAHQAYFKRQQDLFARHGYDCSITYQPTSDNKLPKILLRLNNPEWKTRLQISTTWNIDTPPELVLWRKGTFEFDTLPTAKYWRRGDDLINIVLFLKEEGKL